MRVIHLSYNIPRPKFTDPAVWLRRINFSIGVLESMAKFGEIIGIYHISYRGILERSGVVYHFPGYNKWQLLLPFQFNRYVKNLAPDVVIVHGLIFPWQVVMLRYQLGKKVKILAQHHAERPLKDIRQYFQRWADCYIHAYLFCSYQSGEPWIKKKQIRDPLKVKEVIGSSSPFYPMAKNQAREITKVRGDKIYLWVGDLNANKDPLVAVRSFSKFSKTNPGVQFYMIYQAFELVNEVSSFIKEANTMDAIHLIGKVENPNLQYWYNSADFIISCSHYEGSGIAVCEAMSCGCIPIVTAIPSFRMMTDNGQVGILFKAGNEEELYAALIKSLKLDLEKMKPSVLKQFKEHLSFDANARKIMEVIRGIP